MRSKHLRRRGSLNEVVPYRGKFRRGKFSSGKIFRRGKFSSLKENFVIFPRRKFSPAFIETTIFIFIYRELQLYYNFHTSTGVFKHFTKTKYTWSLYIWLIYIGHWSQMGYKPLFTLLFCSFCYFKVFKANFVGENFSPTKFSPIRYLKLSNCRPFRNYVLVTRHVYM